MPSGNRSEKLELNVLGEPAAIDDSEILRLLVSAVTEYAIFMLDPAGRVATWNPGAERIKGYTAEEIVGQHFSAFYPPDDVAAGKPQRELDLALAKGQSRDEGWRLRKDGSQFWAHVLITAVYDSEGHHQGFAKITRDDTDRKYADEQVRVMEIQSERERISTLMLDTVVHRIFGVGLALDSSLQSIQDGATAGRIRDAVQLLDQTLREIRTFVLAVDDGTVAEGRGGG